MTLPLTDEMKRIVEICKPYTDKYGNLKADAPEYVKMALQEGMRLVDEQEKFALSLW